MFKVVNTSNRTYQIGAVIISPGKTAIIDKKYTYIVERFSTSLEIVKEKEKEKVKKKK